MKKLLVLSLLLILLFTFNACSSQEDIKIGFVTTLTGSYSDIGVAGRNAAQLKVEKINQAGGINGRKIELMIKNDEGNPEKSLAAVQELAEQGVEIIVGPALSNNVLEILDYINQNQILTIGATITSSQLTGLDDYFLRVTQDNTQESILQAEFLIEQGQDKVIALLNTSNQGYTIPWYESFKEEYSSLGGEILTTIKHNDFEQKTYSDLAEKIGRKEEAALVTITSAYDTAMLAQQLNSREYEPFFTTSNWAQTDELIQKGGSAVEGIYTSHIANEEELTPEIEEFKTEYQNRFGSQPNFSAYYNYDALNILAKAMENVDEIKADAIKDEILEIRDFDSLYGELVFDQYGDVSRDYIMLKVHDGEFVKAEVD